MNRIYRITWAFRNPKFSAENFHLIPLQAMDPDGNRHTSPEGLLDDDFDPIQFLDNALPSLTLTSKTQSTKQNRSTQIQAVSMETQTLLSRLNTFNVRTSTELTGLTDEILRSGNRLAYEVEVLRSDANSLYDLLSTTLQDDISYFVQKEIVRDETEDVNGQAIAADTASLTQAPEFMQQLRLLGHVKSRLEEVIRVFGEALKWPIPPSDVSVASSLISVSAPELGVVSSEEDDKARAVIRQYREEITDSLSSEGGGQAGLDAASKRVEDFQNLAIVWKGTAEERARNRVVEGFAKIVEDRKRALGASNQNRSYPESTKPNSQSSRLGVPGAAAGGLWRKLRDEMYLD